LLSKKYQKLGLLFQRAVGFVVAGALIFTQGYLYGFVIDYNRFLYFVLTPVVILIGVFVDPAQAFLRAYRYLRTLTGQLSGPKQQRAGTVETFR
jgi:hypothetical protein